MKNTLEYQRKWHSERKIKLPAVTSIEEEIWMDIIGYEGLYMVSDMGRVKRLSAIISNKRWGSMTVQEKLCRPNNCRGYKYCKLSKEGITEMFLVSRLVAIHFIPNSENKSEVNHLRGKDDNRACFLEWATKKENMEHSVKNGLHKYGEGHPRSKLKKEQVEIILESKVSERKLAAIYKVSRSAINCIKSGRSWKSKTEQYKNLL